MKLRAPLPHLCFIESQAVVEHVWHSTHRKPIIVALEFNASKCMRKCDRLVMEKQRKRCACVCECVNEQMSRERTSKEKKGRAYDVDISNIEKREIREERKQNRGSYIIVIVIRDDDVAVIQST